MTPEQFDDACDYLARLAGRLKDEYRWSLGVAYNRGASQEVKVKSSGSMDPVGEMVVSRFHTDARSSVRRAAKRLGDALDAAREAENQLSSVLRDREREYVRPEGDEPIRKLLPKAERERLEELQKRRMERGEGWGDA